MSLIQWFQTIRILHVHEAITDKSVPRVTFWHHEALKDLVISSIIFFCFSIIYLDPGQEDSYSNGIVKLTLSVAEEVEVGILVRPAQ